MSATSMRVIAKLGSPPSCDFKIKIQRLPKNETWFYSFFWKILSKKIDFPGEGGFHGAMIMKLKQD
jgi:hypothetical protein